MLYVYGFCAAPPADLNWPLGLGAPVVWLGLDSPGAIGAIAEPDVDFAAILADDRRLEQAVLTHDRVLVELCQTWPVLPLSFGTRLRSQTALLEHLGDQQATYRQKLAALGDRAEFLLKLIPVAIAEPAPEATTTSGRAYFLAKKQRLQTQAAQTAQRQAQLAELLAAIAQQYPDWVHPTSDDGQERIYLLIPRSQAATLTELTSIWRSPPLWTLTISPPLPPYHFV